jgi:hypothetical protein
MQPIILFRTDESQGELRVDRFPDFARPVTTINVLTSNFVGTVTVEATIKIDPQESDWFIIHETVFPEFRLTEERKRNTATNVTGRFIHMRATATKALGFPLGIVDRITVI